MRDRSVLAVGTAAALGVLIVTPPAASAPVCRRRIWAGDTPAKLGPDPPETDPRSTVERRAPNPQAEPQPELPAAANTESGAAATTGTAAPVPVPVPVHRPGWIRQGATQAALAATTVASGAARRVKRARMRR